MWSTRLSSDLPNYPFICWFWPVFPCFPSSSKSHHKHLFTSPPLDQAPPRTGNRFHLPLLSLHWVLCWTSHVQLKGDEYMGDWMRCSDCSSMMTSTDGEIAAETVNLATLIWGKSIPHHLASVPVHNQRKKSQEVAQNRQWEATEHPG